jgi:nicotinamidase-related amidase
MRTALLLVDIQNDYFPGGRNELVEPVKAGSKAKMLLNAFRERKMPVMYVQHLSIRPGATFFLPDTPGAEINEIVRPVAGETVIRKSSPNSFRNTGLLQALKDSDVGRLVICGMMTHMCVDSTTRAAFEHGFDCFVAHDACATKNLAFDNVTVPAEQVHRSCLAALSGTFATVTSTEQILKMNF